MAVLFGDDSCFVLIYLMTLFNSFILKLFICLTYEALEFIAYGFYLPLPVVGFTNRASFILSLLSFILQENLP